MMLDGTHFLPVPLHPETQSVQGQSKHISSVTRHTRDSASLRRLAVSRSGPDILFDCYELPWNCDAYALWFGIVCMPTVERKRVEHEVCHESESVELILIQVSTWDCCGVNM